MRPQGSPEELERRRMRAMRLLREDRPPVEVARMVGIDRRNVRRWKAAYRKRGEVALRAKPAPGRPPKLDVEASMRRCNRRERTPYQVANRASTLIRRVPSVSGSGSA